MPVDSGAALSHGPPMGDVVNLRMARKAKARVDAERAAAANRARHGRTRAEKAAEQADDARREALLDGAWREKD